MPSSASRSTQSANGDGHGTSANRPRHGGGTQSLPCSARSRKTATCARVTDDVEQKLPAPQPAVIPRRTSSSIASWNGSACGTSRKSANQPSPMPPVVRSPLETTTGETLPGSSAGEVATISLGPLTVTPAAGVSPNATEASAWNPPPARVTAVPPDAGPDVGESEAT